MMEALAFNPSRESSIGVEMEFQLLDPEGFDLVDGILPLLEICSDNPFIKPEFTQATVEINSRICNSIADLESDVASVVKILSKRCRKLGMTISGGGTHPFCSRLAKITPFPRYLDVERSGGYLGHTLMTYALHVHIGMTSGEETISIMRHLRPYLPLLLALSASSPFWWGHESGYVSYRQRVLAAMRSYGLPPDFQDWQDFSGFFEGAKRAGAFRSIDDIHWDIRPRADMGTLEVRVMDGQPTIRETIMLASFVHLLVEFLRKRLKENRTDGLLGLCPLWIEKENHFQASYRGVDAVFITDEKGSTKPVKDVIKNMVGTVREMADEMEEERHLRLLENVLEEGPSYKRQLKAYKESGSLREVSALLAMELEEDLAGFTDSEDHSDSLSG